MPKIQSKSLTIDPQNLGNIISLTQTKKMRDLYNDKSRWKYGVFMNIIKDKDQRLSKLNPFNAVFLAQPSTSVTGDAPETYFFNFNPLSNEFESGILNSEEDIEVFNRDYSEFIADPKSIFKIPKTSFGEDQREYLQNQMIQTFSSLKEDSDILSSEKVQINKAIDPESTVVNYDLESIFSSETLGAVYSLFKDDFKIDILESITNKNNEYSSKIESFLGKVGDIKKNPDLVYDTDNELEKATKKETATKRKTTTRRKVTMPKNISKTPLKRLSTLEFDKKVEAQTIMENRNVRKFWKGITPDTDNAMQVEIDDYIKRGMWITLAGDTGIGKTFNPIEMAKKNDFGYTEIKLHKHIEHSDLMGAKELGIDTETRQMDTSFLKGSFISALTEAKAAAKEGKGYLLILDEILRVKDNSLFISGFSKTGAGEFGFEFGEKVEFKKIQTANEGDIWVQLTPFREEETSPYTILPDGRVYIHDDGGSLLHSGNENEAAQRAWRESLITMSKDDYWDLIKENNVPIKGSFATNKKIYVPAKALYIIATTNVGPQYSVDMEVDTAFARRFYQVDAIRPDIKYMVKRSIDKEISMRGPDVTKEWKPHIKAMTNILTDFFKTMDKAIAKNASDDEIGQKVNFAMIEQTVESLDDEKPLTRGKFGIISALRITANKFAAIDYSVTTKEMYDHPLVDEANAAIDRIDSGDKLSSNKSRNMSKRVSTQEGISSTMDGSTSQPSTHTPKV